MNLFHPHNPEVVKALFPEVNIIDNSEFIKEVLWKLQLIQKENSEIGLDYVRELNNLIQSHIDMLQSTLDNKNNVTIFTFETATQNPEKVISVLSNMFKLEAQPFNKDTVFNKLNEAIALTEIYNIPIDNKDKLDTAKAVLNQERFADLIAKANELYTKLLVFVEA